MLNPKDTDILSKAIMCEKTGRAYRVIKKELDFYAAHSIALPRIHPDVRISERRERIPKI
ncbi:MAG: hypothetical protein H6767_04970 [Candidatus Peribacteria bacterium]|nr:MAG: hypothetical protein H6767_04970 [Candidatus Peribacteria bacterium]